jgi:CDP-diacylglycerol--serine O-phosphatidyltransferase
MFPSKRPRLRQLPINSLAPNILTTLALCSGLTSILFALQERWQLAVLAVVVAAIFDAIDGRLARFLKGATKFGAELDSLSDFVSFGVAPVILVYLWSLQGLRTFGWLAVLIFSVACALRLARFNTALDDPNRPAWSNDFFVGVPAPAGALLAMLPLALAFETGVGAFRSPWITAPWILLVAVLMVSRIPTFTFKRGRVRRDLVGIVLLLVGLAAALAALEPWLAMVFLGAAYLASIPISLRAQARLRGLTLWQTAGLPEFAPLEGAPGVAETPPAEQEETRLH